MLYWEKFRFFNYDQNFEFVFKMLAWRVTHLYMGKLTSTNLWNSSRMPSQNVFKHDAIISCVWISRVWTPRMLTGQRYVLQMWFSLSFLIYLFVLVVYGYLGFWHAPDVIQNMPVELGVGWPCYICHLIIHFKFLSLYWSCMILRVLTCQRCVIRMSFSMSL